MVSKRRLMGTLASCGVAAAAMAAAGQVKAATFFSTGFEQTATTDSVTGTNYTSYGYQTTPSGSAALLAGQPINSGTVFVESPGAATGTTVTGAVQKYNPTNLSTTSPQYGSITVANLGAGAFDTFSPMGAGLTPVALGTSSVVNVFYSLETTLTAGSTGTPYFGIAAQDSAGNSLAEVYVGAGSNTLAFGAPNGTVTTTSTAVSTSSFTNGFGLYDLQLNTSNGTFSFSQFEGSSYVNLLTGSLETGNNGTLGTVALTTINPTGSSAFGNSAFDDVTVTTSAVPEPTTASLVLGGLVLAGTRRRRRQQA